MGRINQKRLTLNHYAARHRRIGFLFSLPAVAFLLCFVLYPVLSNVWLSFTDSSLIKKTWHFIGFDNYKRMFSNQLFGKYLWNTCRWTFCSVLGQIAVGLAIALLISRKFVGANALRSFLLVPYVVPAVTLALVSKWVLNSDYGIISYWLQKWGWLAERQSLLAMQSTAMGTVVILNIWRSFPFTMLIYWAALKSIDKELYEAATVDGASKFQAFMKITLPLLKDTTIVLIVLRTVWTATYYDLIFMVTGGGPSGSTTHLPILIFQASFGSYQIGYAAAISMVLGVLMFACIVFYVMKSGIIKED